MEKLSIKLENCYGIKKLKQEFNFTDCNTNLIYAKNGSMKTSFAKVFSKIQEGKESEIKDEIHNNQPVIKDIKIKNSEENEREINQEDIFVIKSFVPSYQSKSIESLLINLELKEKLNDVLNLKKQLLKKLEKISGIKISATSGGKKIYKLEPQILEDFGIKDESFLKKLSSMENNSISNFNHIQYSIIFDALDIIKSDDFQNNIEDFLTKSDEVYSSYNFLQKGEFTLAKLKEVQKRLNSNNFFVKDNKIKLSSDEIDKNTLKNKIKEVETKLQDSEEFKNLEKLLQKPKGIPLKDLIEKNPDIIEKLKKINLDCFRKELWQSYVNNDEAINEIFNELKTKFTELEIEINSLDTDNTKWQEAIKIFNNRFFMPFRMSISNLESSIMGESIPKIVFKFPKDGNFENNHDENWTRINRDELENKDTLSQGEKRALYLLNIIFDIEKIKKDIEANPTKKVLFIIDDIADSFDYKNKYAIVEYLLEISEFEIKTEDRDEHGNEIKIKPFKLIILTHNFDFFRFVSKRLKVKKDNQFEVIKKDDGEILLEKSKNDEPWKIWKQNLENEKYIIALIPFVRNLIEYGVDEKKDFLILTHLLHKKVETKYDKNGKILKFDTFGKVKFKEDGIDKNRDYNENDPYNDFIISKTEDLTFEILEEIYKKYLGKTISFGILDKTKRVYEQIKEITDDITEESHNLEDKIILAMAIRFYAEEYMILKINNENFVKKISGSQTGQLYNKFKNKFKTDSSKSNNLRILNSVNIMTPENIHINSFMYEPILDMDIVELRKLYEKVKNLLNGEN